MVAAIATGVVFALNYDGEDFCQHAKAWPNGTYLGQMHPYHSDFYRGYAERRGWDACATWATDQRNSAARGLASLGFTVVEPGQSTPIQGQPASSSDAIPAENYEGENYCRYAPAWPNGTYLGQMHPFHSDFYTRYAEKRGWDPCTTWAEDQKNSAIRGLQALGYAVYVPSESPAQAPTQAPDPAPDPVPDPVPVYRGGWSYTTTGAVQHQGVFGSAFITVYCGIEARIWITFPYEYISDYRTNNVAVGWHWNEDLQNQYDRWIVLNNETLSVPGSRVEEVGYGLIYANSLTVAWIDNLDDSGGEAFKFVSQGNPSIHPVADVLRQCGIDIQ